MKLFAQEADTSNMDVSVNKKLYGYPARGIKPEEKFDFTEHELSGFDKQVASILDESKTDNSKAIIINKAEYKLYLIESGRQIYSCNIEMGWDPYLDKVKSGDGRTPEGAFYVAEKKPWSQFYKAFLISYPSVKHAEVGLDSNLINNTQYNQIVRAVKYRQAPSQLTNLGGLVEIHGEGSGMPGNAGGENWTAGCVAISNKDMDQLFQLVDKGVKILIVKYSSIDIR